MSRRLSHWHGGALLGFAVLCACPAAADEILRRQVHAEFGHRSYMLLEDADGARLYLFPDAHNPGVVEVQGPRPGHPELLAAIDKTHSADARERVRGLAELAGTDSAAALDVAVALLADPSPAVREEAASLILDHPDGMAVALALNLADEED